MSKMNEKQVVLIAGPTASGKTAWAIDIAQKRNGLILNTDSMQIYGVLDRLTARPDAQELQAAPHEMFGHVDPSVRYSTGAWLRDVEDVVENYADDYDTLIFVGGTGLYFDALSNGFAQVPEISAEAVQAAEAKIVGMSEAERMVLLASVDAQAAERLAVADPQRVIRAVSVFLETGQSLSSFQAKQEGALLEGIDAQKLVIMPERAVVRERIGRRFELMLEQGAIAEVEALLALELDVSLPAMKAIGVPEIAAYLRGEMDMAEVIEKSVTASRQYAKRQSTWFRNRFADWEFIDPFA